MIARIESPSPTPGTKMVVPVRFVASAGYAEDWSMYMGWSNWTDEEIAKGGDKVSKETAERIVIDASMARPELRGFLNLHYRL